MAYTDAQLAGFLRKCRTANRKKETVPTEASEPNLKCTPKTVSAEQMERLDAAIRKQSLEHKKGGWRASAKWLEENFPEDYPKAAPKAEHAPLIETCSSDICPNSDPVMESQGLPNAPESPQSAREALPAPPPIPLLESAFWQKVLHGSPDGLLSPADANTALRLVARELSLEASVPAEFSESVRINTLRKMLAERFGAKVWDVMNKLWRAAPASPGAPQPSEDQSREPTGSLPVSRNQPRWIGELNEPGGSERAWLIDNGLWCG